MNYAIKIRKKENPANALIAVCCWVVFCCFAAEVKIFAKNKKAV